MDVSCPKCASEYELDDARVSEEGTTVKCTSCAHVFRVKKKSLVVTLPVRHDVKTAPEGVAALQPAGDLPPAPPLREWKLRQSNGNVFPCRDLTMLQKWIVEGKVHRDDEISLSGETWKRLGNIPELASFFQVVDDAAKARALEAMHREAPVPAAPAPTQGKITDTWRGGTFSPLPQPPPPPEPLEDSPDLARTQPIPFSSSPSGVEPAPTQHPRHKQTLVGGFASVPPEASERQTEPPAPPPAPAPQDPMLKTLQGGKFSALPTSTGSGVRNAAREPTEDELRRAVGGGGSGKWIALVLAGLAVGGAVGWYLGVYEPEQQKLREREAERAALEDEARVRAQKEKDLANAVVVDASVELETPDAAVEVPDAAVAAPEPKDAGAPAVVDAGVPDAGAPDAGAPAKPDAGLTEPKKTYEYYLAQGERLRERERAAQALDFYGLAHDLKPDRVEPMAGKGLCLLDMGNANAAVAVFEQALKLGPRYGPAIMGMAEALRTLGKNEAAIEYYQRYLDVLPNGSEAAVARNSIERLKK